MKFSLFMSAIAGGLLIAASSLPTSASFAQSTLFAESQAMQFTDSQSTPLQTTEVNRVAVLAIAVGGSVALCVGLNAVVDRKRVWASATHRLSRGSFQQHTGASSFNQANRSLQRKLLRLLHEDQGAANRLVAQASLKQPGKAPNWYVEKVIYDLERDRGRY